MRSYVPDGAFDPETVDILISAFEDAWASARSSGAPLVGEDYAARSREILAKSIIETASGGKRDRRKLTEAALLQLSKSVPRK